MQLDGILRMGVGVLVAVSAGSLLMCAKPLVRMSARAPCRIRNQGIGHVQANRILLQQPSENGTSGVEADLAVRNRLLLLSRRGIGLVCGSGFRLSHRVGHHCGLQNHDQTAHDPQIRFRLTDPLHTNLLTTSVGTKTQVGLAYDDPPPTNLG
jgi:hypothetical protein